MSEREWGLSQSSGVVWFKQLTFEREISMEKSDRSQTQENLSDRNKSPQSQEIQVHVVLASSLSSQGLCMLHITFETWTGLLSFWFSLELII